MTNVRVLDLPAREPAPTAEPDSIFFIGNATVLLRFAGITILTDPTFIHMHDEVDLGYGLKSKRLTNPAVDIPDLPPIDFVLLSHFHGDHFDQIAERDLDKALPIVTTAEAAKELEERGFTNTHALDTWEALPVTRGDTILSITATPARHGPPLSDIVMPEVMGSMLDFQTMRGERLLRMYITGDTLVYDDIEEIPRRFPDVDLALFHLGGTRVLGILTTMDAEQGVRMMKIIDPTTVIPIHYNDYDVFTSPLSDFLEEAEQAGLMERIHVLRHGETFSFPDREL